MGLLLGWETALPIAVLVFVVGGIVAFVYRSSLTRYHVPALVLTLLAVTAGMTIAFGIVSAKGQAEEVTYTASPCADSQYRGTTATVRLNYSSLSPAAQDVFLSTVEADGEYTTTTRPDEFEYQGDVGTIVNRISYDSECYLLRADSGGSLGLGLFVTFLLFVGGPVTLLGLTVGLAGLRWRLFTLPLSLVAGAVAGIAAAAVGRWAGEVLAWAAVTAAVTWLVVKVYDTRRSETFRELMDP